MTLLPRRPSPHPPTAHTRPSRRQLAADRDNLEQQRDRAIARERAARDWIGRWLVQTADAHRADAAHIAANSKLSDLDHKAIAGHLAQLAEDFDAAFAIARIDL